MSCSSAATGAAQACIADFVYHTPGSDGQPPQLTTEADKPSAGGEQELARRIAEARAEGFREGESQARKAYENNLAEQRKQVGDALAAFQRETATYYSKAEVQLTHLALAIAGKILHREAQVDRMVVAGLVKVMLNRMQQGTKAIIRIRPEDALSWRHYFNTNADLEIIEDATLEPNACKIETELGIAEMGLDTQLKEVETGFFDLLAQRPGAQ
ncbi:MAG: FliH/SctL family protein [Terriglobales bacterium]|jgi:flagellar assembly protein FliH